MSRYLLTQPSLSTRPTERENVLIVGGLDAGGGRGHDGVGGNEQNGWGLQGKEVDGHAVALLPMVVKEFGVQAKGFGFFVVGQVVVDLEIYRVNHHTVCLVNMHM